MIKLTQEEFTYIADYVRLRYGINLEKKQYLIESRLWIELAKCKAESYAQYWQLLRSDATGQMEQRMIDLLTTNYTYFCREEQHFDFLKEKGLAQLQAVGGERLDILCAGCATGQECYTLAMHLLDYRTLGILAEPFEIQGIDISAQALEQARNGVYAGLDYARLSARWQSLYCHPFAEGEFRVRQSVKEHVRFSRGNLLRPFSHRERFQLIFCRNVMIYFKEAERQILLANLTDALAKGGYLFIGHTESLLGCESSLTYIQPAIYRKQEST